MPQSSAKPHLTPAPTEQEQPVSTVTAEASLLPSPEQLLDAYNQLREEDQRRTLALASAAHELKTPLAIMTGYLQILLSGRLGELNEKQTQVLRAMQANSLRLEDYISDFLTYSSFETSAFVVEFHSGDLIECLTDVFNIWLPRFQDKGVALYFTGRDEPIQFEFDYHKVQRAVSSLIENAFSATPVGGTVWLSAEPYVWERRTRQAQNVSVEKRIASATDPNSVKICVADTGPGIPAEFHQEIFEDFVSFRASDTKEHGTGLGLAIARRLVHALQGKIWVESEVGTGSKFCFLLPLKPTVVPR